VLVHDHPRFGALEPVACIVLAILTLSTLY